MRKKSQRPKGESWCSDGGQTKANQAGEIMCQRSKSEESLTP